MWMYGPLPLVRVLVAGRAREANLSVKRVQIFDLDKVKAEFVNVFEQGYNLSVCSCTTLFARQKAATPVIGI